MKDMILKLAGHSGGLTVTDRDLNDLPKSAIKEDELYRALKKRNQFYKQPR
jgi:hypothetical protein